MESEAHDYEYRDPEHQDLISKVAELYLTEDARTHALLHKVFDLAMREINE